VEYRHMPSEMPSIKNFRTNIHFKFDVEPKPISSNLYTVDNDYLSMAKFEQ
jgi:hypothetical protein